MSQKKSEDGLKKDQACISTDACTRNKDIEIRNPFRKKTNFKIFSGVQFIMC